MGVVISSPVKTSPFFFTSSIIGLVSFGFTLGTFFKVVWVNLETLGEAPHEVHAYLTTLRTELLEEKSNLRWMRKAIKKRSRSRAETHGLDDVSLKTMNDSVKSLIKRFRALEKPFLEDGEKGIGDAPNHRTRSRRRSSISPPYYNHAAYSSPPEKSGRRRRSHEQEVNEEDADEDTYWAQRTKYAKYTLRIRLKWLTRKSEAQDLYETLSRVQIRRIALQVGALAVGLHNHGMEVMEMRDTMRRVDERVSRVIGVRRVDD